MQSYENWYCISFEISMTSDMTAVDFSRNMNLFLKEVDRFNQAIVGGIDETYFVASYVEDFTTGSIRWWLRDRLNNIDDDAIDKFAAKPISTIIASVLKCMKKKVLEWLSKNDHLLLEDQKAGVIDCVYEVIDENKETIYGQDLLGEDLINIKEEELFKAVISMSQLSKDMNQEIFFIEDYEKQDEVIAISTGLAEHFGKSTFEENNRLEPSYAVRYKSDNNQEIERNIVTKELEVYEPRLTENATKWRFILDGKVRNIDISKTSIASDAVKRGEVRVGDTYRVRLEEREHRTPTGQIRVAYKVLEVTDFERRTNF